MTMRTEDIVEFIVKHLLNLTQLAETLEQIVLSQKRPPLLHQQKRVCVANCEFLFRLNVTVCNNVQVASVEVLSAIGRTIVVE